MIVKVIIGVVILLAATIFWHFYDKRKMKRLRAFIKKDQAESSYKPELVPPLCAVKKCEQREGGACSGNECYNYVPVEK